MSEDESKKRKAEEDTSSQECKLHYITLHYVTLRYVTLLQQLVTTCTTSLLVMNTIVLIAVL